MKRRDFLAASCLAAAAGLSEKVIAAGGAAGAKQYLELRHYELGSSQEQGIFDDFLAKAAIPVLNRMGVAPVGVFKMAETEDHNLWVLLPHKSLESVAAANTHMLTEARYLQAGSVVHEAPMANPVYKRFESSLLLGFDHCPAVEVPTKKVTRLFQLRTYESHNAITAKKKIKMFNEGGEIALFRETGLDPVFFGESLIGSKMPNLTYMVGFENSDAQATAWDAFSNHPGWLKLRADAYYKDTVSNITNLVLRPTASSQV